MRKGFTLMELILVIIVLGVALPPIIMVFGESMKGRGRSDDISVASQLAQSLMEEIKTRKWDENTPASGGVADPPTFPIATEESLRRDYDDVDDFAAISNNNPPQDARNNDIIEFSGFTRSVTVEYVEETGGVFGTAASPPTDHKLVTVTVSCDAGTVDLRAIISNKQ